MKKNNAILLFLTFIYILMTVGTFMLRNANFLEDVIMVDFLALICGLLYVIQECDLKIKK